MQPSIMRDFLLSQKGVFRLETLDASTLMDVMRAEMSVNTITGGMRLENIGVMQCAHRQYVGVMFCSGEFDRPEECGMYMVDDLGTVIGREIVGEEKREYINDPTVVWLSDTMAIFADKITAHDAKFVISAVDYRPLGMHPDMSAVIYFPAVTTARMINERFGVDDDNGSIWTVIIGVDGVFPDKGAVAEAVEGSAIGIDQMTRDDRIGSCGRCGGCSRWTGPPL